MNISAKKIIPSIGHCYTGAFLGEGALGVKRINAFINKSGATPKIVMWFHAFAAGFSFPAIEARLVKSYGSIPFIKLEPWSWKGRDDDSFSLEKIINGEFDDKILTFAKGAKKAKMPMFISFGHEMNANWYPWAGDPAAYKSAFKRIFELFQKANAANVTWVFNANADPHSNIADYYPGDEFTDWLALDGFNWGNTQNWSKWQSFSDIFMNAYEGLLKMSDKPIMIGEFASTETGGNKAEWIKTAFHSMKFMARIKAFVWFDMDKSQKETDWRVDSSPESLEAFRNELKDPYFI